ncbi:MAG: hypothetical protein ABFC31_09325 [Clostridiaceae bacterium]
MMNAGWICPRCGCTASHYRQSEMRFACDQCGQSADDPQQDQQRQAFDRSIRLAQDHLRVGNWMECAAILRLLSQQRPADPRPYKLLLTALTQNYTDFLLGSSPARSEAELCWTKLQNLRGLDGAMLAYALQRKDAYKGELGRKRMVTMLALFAAAALLLTAAIVSEYFLTMLALGATTIVLWRVLGYQKPWKVVAELRRLARERDSNPFRQLPGA